MGVRCAFVIKESGSVYVLTIKESVLLWSRSRCCCDHGVSAVVITEVTALVITESVCAVVITESVGVLVIKDPVLLWSENLWVFSWSRIQCCCDQRICGCSRDQGSSAVVIRESVGVLVIKDPVLLWSERLCSLAQEVSNSVLSASELGLVHLPSLGSGLYRNAEHCGRDRGQANGHCQGNETGEGEVSGRLAAPSGGWCHWQPRSCSWTIPFRNGLCKVRIITGHSSVLIISDIYL